MTDDLHSPIDEVTQFHVGGLEGGEMFLRIIRVQIARFNTGKLRQVVDHLLLSRNVIVQESCTGKRPLTEN